MVTFLHTTLARQIVGSTNYLDGAGRLHRPLRRRPDSRKHGSLHLRCLVLHAGWVQLVPVMLTDVAHNVFIAETISVS